MDWKQFLRPDWKKAITFVVLILLSSLISNQLPVVQTVLQREVITNYGFPFSWIQQKCTDNTGALYSENQASCSASYMADQLALDLIFWYLISCLLVYFRKILTPDWRKIVTFSVVFGLPLVLTVLFLSQNSFPINMRILSKGFPLEFSSFACREGALINDCYLDIFNYTFLSLDMIFLYVVSCLVVWIYDKIRKK